MMIEIQNFTKRYNTLTAVDNINLSVKESELFGIIGPDGAGKTSLMRTICTLLLPDEGSIKVKGMDTKQDTAEIRSILGYMPQRFSLYQDLTVVQNLNFFAELFQVSPDEQENRLKELYRFSRLEPFKNRRAGDLSGGMKQKLALSCALIHTPEILILDEPTFGIDPVSRDEFWEILHTIRERGTTILVSTAYMNEAMLCDRVALFFNGRIQVLDKPDNLIRQYKYPLFQIRARDQRSIYIMIKNHHEVHTIQKFGDSLHVSFLNEPETDLWENWDRASEGNIISWEKIEPSIEDIFLENMENDSNE